MVYFTRQYLNFFAELAANNDRDWFNTNKARFKSEVEKPFLKFVEDLIDRASAIHPAMLLTAKDAVFRIYRDTRFAADKTPYKLHMSAVISPGGRKGMLESGLYIQMGGEDFSIYGGAYMPEKEGLKNLREAIAADLSGFEKLINASDFKEKYGEIKGEENKRLPPELAEAAAKQPLLFKKSFYYFHKFEPEIILQDDLVDICMAYWLAGKPVGDFLADGMKRA